METTNPAPDNESSSAATTIILPAPASTSPGSVRLQFGAQTHVGKVRSNNEDQYLVARACKSLDILATIIGRRWAVIRVSPIDPCKRFRPSSQTGHA
jgi:hypothetical protein